jgi:hypothetical protein
MGYYDNAIYKAKHPEQQGLSQGELFNLMAKEGKAIIRNNLYIYAKTHLTGMLFIIITPGTNNLVRRSWGEDTPGFREMKHGKSMMAFIITVIRKMPVTFIIFATSAIMLAIVYLLSIAGILACGKTRTFEAVFLLLTAAYFIFISGGPAATDRFRDPFNFIIAIWAGIGVDWAMTYKGIYV